jgi:hypothetical protein
LDRRLGGPQSRSGRGDEEKNSQPLPGLEAPIIQPATQRYTTELTLLHSVFFLIKYLLKSAYLSKNFREPNFRRHKILLSGCDDRRSVYYFTTDLEGPMLLVE